MNKAEITQAQLAAWSESYRACPQRKLAALALGKTDLNEVAFVPEGAWKMRGRNHHPGGRGRWVPRGDTMGHPSIR